MMGRLLYVLGKSFSNCSILLLERICIGIACYPILLIIHTIFEMNESHVRGGSRIFFKEGGDGAFLWKGREF
jgi:hypothetical protein